MAKNNDKNNKLYELLDSNIKNISKILILSDELLTIYKCLMTDSFKMLHTNRQIDTIELYDPKGKIEFKYGGELIEIKNNIINDIWSKLGLEEMNTRSKLEKINEALIDPDLMDEFEEAIKNSIDGQSDGRFNYYYENNITFKKWIDKLIIKTPKGRKISESITKKYQPGYEIRTIKELKNVDKNTLIICVSSKIVSNGIFTDVINDLLYYKNKMIFYETTRDNISIYQMLNLTVGCKKELIKGDDKHEEYLVICNID